MPNHQEPLILLGHFDFDPAKRPSEKNFFSPFFTSAAARRARPRAPPRALPRLFALFRDAPQKGRSRREFHPSASPFRLFDHRQQRLGGGGVEEAVEEASAELSDMRRRGSPDAR